MRKLRKEYEVKMNQKGITLSIEEFTRGQFNQYMVCIKYKGHIAHVSITKSPEGETKAEATKRIKEEAKVVIVNGTKKMRDTMNDRAKNGGGKKSMKLMRRVYMRDEDPKGFREISGTEGYMQDLAGIAMGCDRILKTDTDVDKLIAPYAKKLEELKGGM